MIFKILILYITTNLALCGTLISTIFITRHGNRAPNKEKFINRKIWLNNDKEGELTFKGCINMHLLGQNLLYHLNK